ncbi:MAG: hypothetical protein ACLGGV_05570 [Bacteroidia bacterium]
MSIETVKIDLAKQLFSVNKESVLERIKKILDKEIVVAYTTNGKPLTAEQYKKEVLRAKKEKSVSHKHVLEEIKTWK